MDREQMEKNIDMLLEWNQFLAKQNEDLQKWVKELDGELDKIHQWINYGRSLRRQ